MNSFIHISKETCRISDYPGMATLDDLFWTFAQALSYYKIVIINHIGVNDKGMVPVGGCGDTNGKSQIDKSDHLRNTYKFGRNIYRD